MMLLATLLAPVAWLALTVLFSYASIDGKIEMGELGYGDPTTGRTQTLGAIVVWSGISAFILTAIGYVVTIGFLLVIWFATKPER